MSLVDQIRMDVQLIIGNAGEYGTPILFQPPAGESVTIIGTRTKHHLGLNREGVAVNTKTASVSVSEYALQAADYAYRDAAGAVKLIGHKVTYTDASGLTGTYVIRETFPDEMLGLIVCILGDFK